MKTTCKFRIFSFLFFILVFTLNYGCTDPVDKPDGSSLGTVKDKDGNVYKTIKIGSQVWMAENLKSTKYNNGTEIINVTSNIQWTNLTTGAYCNYENLESNSAKYGRLYNWYAVNTGKLAPAGWRVPTDEDWTVLVNYLIAKGYNYDGTKDINKIAKSLAATTDWTTSTYIGAVGNDLSINNSIRFTALPGGFRYNDGSFESIGSVGVWWCSTEYNTSYAWFRDLYYYNNFIDRGNENKNCGFSVRCVKDL